MESIKKGELSDFDPIEIEIKEKPKSLDLKIKKVKGEVKNISLLDKDIDQESFQLYQEAKELEPTEKIPNPYWNIYYLISPISMYSPGTKYNKTSEFNKNWISDFSGKTENKILSYSPITGILNCVLCQLASLISAVNGSSTFRYAASWCKTSGTL